MGRWSFKDPNGISFDNADNPDMPTLVVKQDLESIPELKTSSKMFLAPRVYNIWAPKLPKSEDRKQDFYFSCPFEKRDTTVLKVPAGYKPEALPSGRTIQHRYAQYISKYWYDEKTNCIYSTSSINLQQYKIPAVDYPSVKKFFDDVLKDNSERIVLKKAE